MRKSNGEKQSEDIIYGFPGRRKESNRSCYRTQLFPMPPAIPKLQAHIQKPE
jgi:hypothetical protein